MTLKFPFHLAFPVTDLEKARAFYCDILGCSSGESPTPGLTLIFLVIN